MAIQTAAGSSPNLALSNAITTRYTCAYQEGADVRRVYDQLCMTVGAPQFDLETRRGMGSTYTFNFLGSMAPSTETISEVTDVTPQVLRDATATITPTSRFGALKWSELVDLEVYTDYVAQRARVLGENHMEVVDNLAKNVAIDGKLVVRAAARTSIDAGSSGHRWLPSKMWEAYTRLQTMRCPPVIINGQSRWMAIAHPDVYHDLLNAANEINSIALYQDKEILFNGEVGQYANLKIIVSPWAKVFYAAGAANTTACATTISAAANALSTSLTAASAAGTNEAKFMMVGTIETSTTYYDNNETFVNGLYGGSSSTTVTLVGQGENGGLRFDHASGATLSNADNVYPVIYGSPYSLVKVYANETGEYGEFVGPKYDGILNQFQEAGWKYYGGVGLIAENKILRGEYSSSVQAT